MYGIQFPTDPMKDHFLSSVYVCLFCWVLCCGVVLKQQQHCSSACLEAMDAYRRFEIVVDWILRTNLSFFNE